MSPHTISRFGLLFILETKVLNYMCKGWNYVHEELANFCVQLNYLLKKPLLSRKCSHFHLSFRSGCASPHRQKEQHDRLLLFLFCNSYLTTLCVDRDLVLCSSETTKGLISLTLLLCERRHWWENAARIPFQYTRSVTLEQNMDRYFKYRFYIEAAAKLEVGVG